jgi:MFS family permease
MIGLVKRRWHLDANPDIRRLYWAYALRCPGILLPVIVVYNSEMMGLSFAEFLLAEAIFALAMVVLEIPTGWLSDIWRRRTVMIASAMCWTASYIYLMVAHGLFDAIMVQVIMALGASFASGTVQAMLYEYLAEEGREGEFRKAEGMRFALSFYGLALMAPLAGAAYAVDERFPVILTLGLHYISLAQSLALREPARVKRHVERNPFYDMLKTMRYALYGHREIAAIILLAAILAAGTKLLMWIQQPYFQAAGLPVEWYGWMCAAAFGLVAINSQLVHKLERWIKPVKLLGLLMLVEISLPLLAGSWVWLGFAPLLLVGQALYGLNAPVIADIISQRADPARRATILSAQSLMAQLTFTVLSVPYGALSDSGGVASALWALAAVLAALGIPAWLYLRWRVKE